MSITSQNCKTPPTAIGLSSTGFTPIGTTKSRIGCIEGGVVCLKASSVSRPSLTIRMTTVKRRTLPVVDDDDRLVQ